MSVNGECCLRECRPHIRAPGRAVCVLCLALSPAKPRTAEPTQLEDIHVTRPRCPKWKQRVMKPPVPASNFDRQFKALDATIAVVNWNHSVAKRPSNVCKHTRVQANRSPLAGIFLDSPPCDLLHPSIAISA